MIKKAVFLLLILSLALALYPANAEAENGGILGKPFPDFSVTDSQGNAFTLSEALKDHEAVLINIWATWCYPCEREFPFLNHLYEQYGDRAAFIALSCEPEDTAETIEAYRRDHGIAFPMGRDEGQKLQRLIGETSIPATVIVDRFGNAAFLHIGSFLAEQDAERSLNVFLGDSYTQTIALSEIPPDTSSFAFPVVQKRNIAVENESARLVHFHAGNSPRTYEAYVVSDDSVRLRAEITINDDPAIMVLSCIMADSSSAKAVREMYDPERGAFVCDFPMPAPSDESHLSQSLLYFWGLGLQDPDTAVIYLISGEAYISEFAALMEAYGLTDVRWEFAEQLQEETAPQAYVLHIVDQHGAPVPDVYVNFCTDTACTMMQADETGTISFEGVPDVYHVQLLKAPDGYSADPDFEFSTGPAYGEWVLRVKKD